MKHIKNIPRNLAVVYITYRLTHFKLSGTCLVCIGELYNVFTGSHCQELSGRLVRAADKNSSLEKGNFML